MDLSDWSKKGFKSYSATVGATAIQPAALAQVGSTSTPLAHGVAIKALPGNTGTVFVGFASGVTNGTTGAATTDGWPLAAGEELDPELADLFDLWLIGSAAGQGFCLIYR